MLTTDAVAETATGDQGRLDSGPGHRRDIQGLRAVAVLLVVLGHMGIPALAGGYIGVDVFFVISGFLITGLLVKEANQERGISFADFYARRARRILPAASVVLLSTLIAAFFLLGNVRIGEIARETIWAALFAANWKFSSEGTDYFDSSLPPSPLQHFWSLGVEEQFYLIWPALLFVVLFAMARRSMSRPGRFRHRPSRQRWLILVGVLSLIAGGSLFYSIVFTAAAPAGAYFSTLTRAWELAVGALLAVTASQLRHIPAAVKAAMTWLGMIGIGLSAVVLDETTAFPGAVALLPVLSTALVLAGGIAGPRYGAAALLGTRPFTWIGDRSYSLYLWHWPALILAAAYLGHDLSLAQSSAMILIALLLTILTYAFIEHPIHAGRLRANRAVSLMLWPTSFAVLSLVVLVSLDSVRAVDSGNSAVAGFDVPAATPPAGAPPGTAAPAPTGPAPTAALPGQPSASDPIGQAVAAAVAAAMAGDPIPEVLAPSIDQLRADSWRSVVPENCYALDTESTSDICSYGPDDAQRSMVIFGDSIAGMWLPALERIAENSGWRLYYLVKTSCPVANLVEWNPEDTANACPQWREWALGEIQKLAPDVVLLSTRGQSSSLASGKWEAGMVSTIQTLQQASPRVVVFSETPLALEDPVSCLDRPGAILADCTWELNGDVAALIAADRRASATAGAEFLDLLPWFCSSNRCPLVVNQMIVSYGAEHVTNTYGLALADSLAVALALT